MLYYFLHNCKGAQTYFGHIQSYLYPKAEKRIKDKED